MPFDDFHFNNFHNGHKLMVKSYKVTSLQAKLWVCVTRLPPPAMFITPDMEAETPVLAGLINRDSAFGQEGQNIFATQKTK